MARMVTCTHMGFNEQGKPWQSRTSFLWISLKMGKTGNTECEYLDIYSRSSDLSKTPLLWHLLALLQTAGWMVYVANSKVFFVEKVTNFIAWGAHLQTLFSSLFASFTPHPPKTKRISKFISSDGQQLSLTYLPEKSHLNLLSQAIT